jgi:hypothetical protein
MLSFTERMEIGHDLAQVTRNLGRPVGAPAKGWNVKRRDDHDGAAGSWEALCREAKRSWRSDCRLFRNDFAAACLNPINDEPMTWEFN